MDMGPFHERLSHRILNSMQMLFYNNFIAGISQQFFNIPCAKVCNDGLIRFWVMI